MYPSHHTCPDTMSVRSLARPHHCHPRRTSVTWVLCLTSCRGCIQVITLALIPCVCTLWPTQAQIDTRAALEKAQKAGRERDVMAVGLAKSKNAALTSARSDKSAADDWVQRQYTIRQQASRSHQSVSHLRPPTQQLNVLLKF